MYGYTFPMVVRVDGGAVGNRDGWRTWSERTSCMTRHEQWSHGRMPCCVVIRKERWRAKGWGKDDASMTAEEMLLSLAESITGCSSTRLIRTVCTSVLPSML